MTVRGHTFEHDYPPTPFNEPIRPLPEAGLKAEPTERTHEELQFLSFFSNSLTLLKIHWVSTQILLLNETVPSIQDSAKYTWKEVTVMQWLVFGSSSLCFYLVKILSYFFTVRLPWYSKLPELADSDINDFRGKSLVTDFCECQRRSEFGQCHSRRYT